MDDDSYLDNKYFVDEYVYNCPFCNRRNVSYFLSNIHNEFDWNPGKKCYTYFTVCESCGKKSMHLSFDKLTLTVIDSAKRKLRFRIDSGDELDNKFFYSVPTSFFSVDKRIPKILRQLIAEAEGCLMRVLRVKSCNITKNAWMLRDCSFDNILKDIPEK